MTNPPKKRLSWVVAVVVIAVVSSAILIRFGAPDNSQVESSTTSTSTSTSSPRQNSTSTSSSIPGFSTFIGFNQVYPGLFATPIVPLNYSITISQFETTGRSVTVSAASTVPGVTVTVTPAVFTFIGTQEAVALEISVAPTVTSAILPVNITARTTNGAVSQTFDFRLNKALVVILPNAGLTPQTLRVSVGQGVTWLDLLDPGDEGNGQANVLLADGTPPSSTMTLNDVWSHTFDKPGTYPYQVTLNGYVTQNATVVVG